MELCNRSTYYNGTKAWKVAGKHVTEAKRRGLSCGVTETTLKKKTCAEDVRVCPGAWLCTESTTTSKNGIKIWDTKVWYDKYVAEAKRRGLTCGVTEKRCSDDISFCSQSDVCRAAT